MILFHSTTYWYAWLSNFFPCSVTTKDGRVWPSVEHAYQTLKSTDFDEQERIRKAVSAKQAKYFSHLLKFQRSDWSDIKIDVMTTLVTLKFEQNSELREKLSATGDEELVHYCPWGDFFWGVGRNKHTGDNNLGKILMKIRKNL